MIKCINSNSLQEAQDTQGLIDQAQKSDFDGLELSLEPTGPLGEIAWEDLRNEICNSNLKIVSLTTTQFDLFTLAGLDGESERNKALDAIKQLLHCAATVNPDTIITISAQDRHPEGQGVVDDYETAFNTLFQSVAELACTAEKQSVLLAIESPAAGLLLSPLELRDFIDQINSPYFGLCLNPTHTAHLGNPLDWLRILDQRIFALHLKLLPQSNVDTESLPTDLYSKLISRNRIIPLIYK
jgi:L-ribulose-5-phosphate 3-epimerase